MAQSEDLPLRLAIESMLDPYVVLRAVRDDTGTVVDFVFTEANSAAAEFNRLDRHELLGRRLLDLHPAAGTTELLDLYRSVLVTGAPLVLDDWSYPQDLLGGEERRYDVRAVRLDRDHISQTWRDVTDRYLATQALTRSALEYRLLAENAGDVVVRTRDGIALWVSPSAKAVFGWEPSDMVGTDLTRFVHPDDAPVLLAARGAASTTGAASRLRYRVADAAGQWRWVDVHTRAWVDDDGNADGFVGALRDVTDEVGAQQALSESEANFRLLAENAASVVSRMTNEGVPQWVSPSVTGLLGWLPTDLVGRPMSDLVHPFDLDRLRSGQDLASAGQEATLEVRIRHRDGDYRWFAISLRPTLDDQGRVVGRVAGWHDIHDEHRARELLARSERLFRTAMASAPVGMAVLSLERRFQEVNPALSQLLGRSAAWLLHHRLDDVLDPAHHRQDRELRREILMGARITGTQEKRLLRADGSTLWTLHSVGLLRDDFGAPAAFISHFVDVTEARRDREQLRQLATHDPLTGLLNRRALEAELAELLAACANLPRPLGVLFLDLDWLKVINDTHGHVVGDRVLTTCADRLVRQAGDGALVARYGGDEFVIAIPDVRGPEQACAQAERLAAAIAEPVRVGEVDVNVSFSIGIAVAEPGDQPDDVLHRADAALYRVKRTGRARIAIYDPAFDDAGASHPPVAVSSATRSDLPSGFE